NVIPSEARAMLNIRLLPGDTIDVLIAELTKLVNDPNIRFEVQPDAGLATPVRFLCSDHEGRGAGICGRAGAAVLVRRCNGFGSVAAAQRAGLWRLSLSHDRRGFPPHARRRRAHSARLL